MSVTIHCKINMFDRYALIVVEDDGDLLVNEQIRIPIDQLNTQLPILIEKYKCNNLHFVGTASNYVNGIANNFKRRNTKFGYLEVTVN